MIAIRTSTIYIVLVSIFLFANASSLPAAEESRMTVFISDLHFGVGMKGDAWDPTEDFRWSDDLKDFLDNLRKDGKDAVDLVILGDLLELWQPKISCASLDPNWGCTTIGTSNAASEEETIVKDVIAAHKNDLKLLASFSRNGNNRLFIVPGNHDAALLVPSVWKLVSDEMELKPDEDRINIVRSGVWTSNDGTIVAEHGHQIGGDVNLYPEWPKITNNEDPSGKVRRPWGEFFVQKLYNQRETEFPLIDNLSPESAGVRYYMGNRGLFGTAEDAARFVWFNLFETSLYQRMRALGPQKKGEEFKWNTEGARNLGYKLFAGALPAKDSFRQKLVSSKDGEWENMRKALDDLAKNKTALNDDRIKVLCAHLDARSKENPADWKCSPTKLGNLVEHTLIPREWVMRAHLNLRLAEYPNMQTFIYAHTHELWFDWAVRIQNSRTIKVFNTGAFQRLIDDEAFKSLAKEHGLDPVEAMSSLPMEKLPACYSGVYIGLEKKATVKNWYRSPTGNGQIVPACDSRCSKVSRKCQEMPPQ